MPTAYGMGLAIGTSRAITTATSALALTTHLLTGRGLDIPVTANANSGTGSRPGSRPSRAA